MSSWGLSSAPLVRAPVAWRRPALLERREWVRLDLRLDDMEWRLCAKHPVLMATLMEPLCF